MSARKRGGGRGSRASSSSSREEVMDPIGSVYASHITDSMNTIIKSVSKAIIDETRSLVRGELESSLEKYCQNMEPRYRQIVRDELGLAPQQSQASASRSSNVMSSPTSSPSISRVMTRPSSMTSPMSNKRPLLPSSPADMARRKLVRLGQQRSTMNLPHKQQPSPQQYITRPAHPRPSPQEHQPMSSPHHQQQFQRHPPPQPRQQYQPPPSQFQQPPPSQFQHQSPSQHIQPPPSQFQHQPPSQHRQPPPSQFHNQPPSHIQPPPSQYGQQPTSYGRNPDIVILDDLADYEPVASNNDAKWNGSNQIPPSSAPPQLDNHQMNANGPISSQIGNSIQANGAHGPPPSTLTSVMKRSGSPPSHSPSTVSSKDSRCPTPVAVTSCSICGEDFESNQIYLKHLQTCSSPAKGLGVKKQECECPENSG